MKLGDEWLFWSVETHEYEFCSVSIFVSSISGLRRLGGDSRCVTSLQTLRFPHAKVEVDEAVKKIEGRQTGLG